MLASAGIFLSVRNQPKSLNSFIGSIIARLLKRSSSPMTMVRVDWWTSSTIATSTFWLWWMIASSE